MIRSGRRGEIVPGAMRRPDSLYLGAETMQPAGLKKTLRIGPAGVGQAAEEVKGKL